MSKIARLHDTNSLLDLKKKGIHLEAQNDFTTIFSIIEYPKALEMENLTILFPDKSIYEDAVTLSNQLLEKGTPIPAMDILIACIAIQKKLELRTNDKHFEFVKAIYQQFKFKAKISS